MAGDLNKFNTLAKLQPQPPTAGVTIDTTAAAAVASAAAAAKTAPQHLSSTAAQVPQPWQAAAASTQP